MNNNIDLFCEDNGVLGKSAKIWVAGHSGDDEGNIFISYRCIGVKEVQQEIERIKHELNVILKQSERFFGGGK